MLEYVAANHHKSVSVEFQFTDQGTPVASRQSAHPALPIFLLGADPAMEADLCEHLWSHPSFDLLAAHYDVRSAMRVVEALEPELLIVHVGQEDTDLTTFIGTFRARYPQIPVLVSFSKSGLRLRAKAFEAGASSELGDIEDATLCHQALEAAIRARTPAVINACADGTAGSGETGDIIELAPIEIEIGRYLAAGRSILEIANHLGLPPKTISLHRSTIRQALFCRTNTELSALLSKYCLPAKRN